MRCLIGFIVLSLSIVSTDAFAQQADKQKLTNEFFNMDANKDGVISMEEIEAYSDRAFNEMDRDTNQYLDTNEVAVKSEPGEVLKGADTDKNGQVSREEARQRFRGYFKAMDTNQNNQVTQDEYSDYWKARVNF